MDKNVIPAIAAVILFCADIIYGLILRKKVLTKAGKCLLLVQKKRSYTAAAILVTCAVLIVLLFLIDLGFVNELIIAGCISAGGYVGVKSLVLRKRDGLYENAVINNERFLLFDDIKTVINKTSEASDSDATASANSENSKHFSVITKKNETMELVFDTEKAFCEIYKSMKSLFQE